MSTYEKIGIVLAIQYIVFTGWWWWRVHDLVQQLSIGLRGLQRVMYYVLLISWPVSMFALPVVIRLRKARNARRL